MCGRGAGSSVYTNKSSQTTIHVTTLLSKNYKALGRGSPVSNPYLIGVTIINAKGKITACDENNNHAGHEQFLIPFFTRTRKSMMQSLKLTYSTFARLSL
jgi:hypothetical protein